jgi:CelD/BcsL family acetyltransferase involved in cellulose biosynthesis
MASIALPGPAYILRRIPEDALIAGDTPTLRLLDWQCGGAPSIVARWDALAREASEPNPFLESWFLLPALRGLAPSSDVQLLLLEQGERLIGLLPVSRNRRYYRHALPHLAGWSHPNAFLGTPLVARGCEQVFWRALLAWADRSAGQALFLQIAQLNLEGPLFEALTSLIAVTRRTGAVVRHESRALLVSGRSPEDYYQAAVSGKKRKELRRQLNRLGELGAIEFERRGDAIGLDDWTDAFLALEAAGWKGSEGSALGLAKPTADLFCQALAGAAAQGRLERLTLTLDGRPIAMLANFVCPPGMFSFKTAYDESLAKYSPGVLLQCENLMVLARDDIAWSDSCAAADHPMIDRLWRERRPVGDLSLAIGGTLRRALFGALVRVELRRSRGKVRP